MSTINKVPASAGAEWLLAGLALLRKAPLALGTLGVLWGLASLVVVLVATAVPSLLYALQLLLMLAGPLFFAAMVWAVREVDQDRPALPAHLLQPIRDGHARPLLLTLLPQLLGAILLGALLLVMVGTDELKHLADVLLKIRAIAEVGGQPDPALMADLPAGRLLLWLLLVVVAFVLIKWMTFIAMPQILFDRTDVVSAIRNSLRACLHNWTAMLVFYLLAGIAIFAFTFGLLLLTAILQFIVGPAFAGMVMQLLLLAVLMPVLAGAVYTAWQQMLGDPSSSTRATTPSTHLEA